MSLVQVLRTRVDPVNYHSARDLILDWAGTSSSHYVCVANVHMLMEASDSASFRDVINSADLVTPDGMPLVWMMRLKGVARQTRVYGPSLMLHVLEATARDGIPVGFYGSSPEVLEALVERMRGRFPNLNVVYKLSPPYRELSSQEDGQIVEEIRLSGAKILFVGLGCPRQEQWMAAHRDRLDCVQLGVGAAFDFHAGLKPQAPAWLQAIGLEWFFRLLTEPRRLWRRYFLHNPRFIFLAVLDLLGLIR